MIKRTAYYRERIRGFLKNTSDRFSSYLNGMNISARRRVLVIIFIVCVVLLLLQAVMAYVKLINKM